MGLSIEAQKVFDSLDKETKEALRKDNPFKKIRNGILVDLGKKGTNGKLLGEISGLSDSSLSRILQTGGQGGFNINRREVKKERELWFLKQEFDLVLKRFRAFVWAENRKEGKKGTEGRRKRS